MIAHVRFTSTGAGDRPPVDRVDVLPVDRGVSLFLDAALAAGLAVVGFEMNVALGDYRRKWVIEELAP